MKLFRILVSIFLVLLGVMMVVTWAFSSKSVQAIENGEAAAKLTDKVLSNPNVASLASQRVTDEVHTSLQSQFDSQAFDLLWGFAEQPIQDAVASVISSDFVANAADAGATRVQARLVEALTDADRPYGPLMLSIDVSPRLNDRIDQIPTVGGFVPDITVPPLELEVIDAAVFEDVRSAYSAATWVSTWFGWLGLLAIALGVVVSPRRQWFLARSMLVAGVVVVAIGFTISAVGAHTIATFMPGGAEGGLGVAVSDLLSDTAIPTVSTLLLQLGAVALALALISVLVVRYVPVFRDRVRTQRQLNEQPLVHQEHPRNSLGTAVASTSESGGALAQDPARASGQANAGTVGIPTTVPLAYTVGSSDDESAVPGQPPARKPTASRVSKPTQAKSATPKPASKAASKPASAATPAAKKPGSKSAVPKKTTPKKPRRDDEPTEQI